MSGWDRNGCKGVALTFVALLLVSHFVALGWRGLLANTSSDSGDQGAYLLLGLDIREGRALTDGNRHPLFPLLIAPFARREWSYFTTAKMVSLLTGGLALLIIYFLSWRLYGQSVALITLVLLNLNQELLDQTPQVLCETLLVLAFFAAWYGMVRALQRPTSVKTGAVAGALVGLAYLTKGTGQLLLITFLGTVLILYRKRILHLRCVWAFIIGYLLVASPLLAYNVARYGHPFYNFNTAHAMWLEGWGDRYVSVKDLPTAWTYLRSHSPGQMLGRLGRGVVTILPVFGRALLPGPRETLLTLVEQAWVWFLLVGVILLAVSQQHLRTYLHLHREEVLCTSLILSILYLFCAWYAPVTRAARFFLPLVPIIYLGLSKGLVSMLSWVESYICLPKRWWNRVSPLLGVLLWSSVGIGAGADGWRIHQPHGGIDAFASDRESNREADEVAAWLNEMAGGGLKVLWGPSHTLPKWKFLPQLELQAIPSYLERWDQFEDFIARQDFRYIVLDRKMYNRRASLLSRYLDKDGARILFRDIPPGWIFAFAQEGGIINPEWGSINWYIVEVAHAGTGIYYEPISPIRLGEVIQLIGYELAQETLHPGEFIDLTLVWRAEARPREDYTVFVHLVDEGGQVWGQVDRFPLAGMYPSSWWKVGTEIVDRYRVHLDPRTPPGEYSVVVGMYHPWTRVRLPAVTVEGRPLFQEQIPLPTPLKVELDHLFTIPLIQHRQRAQLGRSIRLLGYDAPHTRVPSGGTLSLTLYWQAREPVDTSYTVFTHLINDKGEIWGQWDNIPAAGNRPTTDWLTDEVIADPYTIPLRTKAAPGYYRIEVGMYDVSTGQRLPVLDEAGQRVVSDRVLLDTPIWVDQP